VDGAGGGTSFATSTVAVCGGAGGTRLNLNAPKLIVEATMKLVMNNVIEVMI
jgi:hypothetical protein